MLGPWCCLGILSVMEGKVEAVLAWTVQSSRVSWQRCLQATESFNWKSTQSSECVPTEAILFKKSPVFRIHPCSRLVAAVMKRAVQ